MKFNEDDADLPSYERSIRRMCPPDLHMSSNYIMDRSRGELSNMYLSRIRLIRAGDIETNPGPNGHDENRYSICRICMLPNFRGM